MSVTENTQRSSGFLPGLVAARAHLPLPVQADFCRELEGDAGYAWRNFGGLSLENAYQKFFESPEIYQEDFMWMFPRAFEYYYPVVDRYLRNVSITDEDHYFFDGCQACILGHDLEAQFHWADGARPPDYVVAEIRALAEFVRQHLPRFSTEPREQERIDASWVKLQETLSSIT